MLSSTSYIGATKDLDLYSSLFGWPIAITAKKPIECEKQCRNKGQRTWNLSHTCVIHLHSALFRTDFRGGCSMQRSESSQHNLRDEEWTGRYALESLTSDESWLCHRSVLYTTQTESLTTRTTQSSFHEQHDFANIRDTENNKQWTPFPEEVQ